MEGINVCANSVRQVLPLSISYKAIGPFLP